MFVCVCKHAYTYLTKQIRMKQNNKKNEPAYTHWWRTSNGATLTGPLWEPLVQQPELALLQDSDADTSHRLPAKQGNLQLQHLTPVGTQEMKHGDLVGFQKVGWVSYDWLKEKKKSIFSKN